MWVGCGRVEKCGESLANGVKVDAFRLLNADPSLLAARLLTEH